MYDRDFVSRDLAAAITNWASQNWAMLRRNYPQQYVACGLGEVVAHGENFDLVLRNANNSGRAFIMHWTLLPRPALQVPSIASRSKA
jgi:hypothetical protein